MEAKAKINLSNIILSDVYQRYIHLGVETFQKLSNVLANT